MITYLNQQAKYKNYIEDLFDMQYFQMDHKRYPHEDLAPRMYNSRHGVLDNMDG